MKFPVNYLCISWKQLVLLLALSLFLSACGGDDTPSTPTIEATATEVAVATSTPSPTLVTKNAQSANVSPLDVPVSPIAAPESRGSEILPEPDAGKANSSGRLVALFGEATDYKPVVISAVYLAPVIEGGVAALDSAVDPSSSTNLEGYFVFNNVKPGTYGFVVYYNFNHYLIRDEAGEQLVITLKADESNDMGEIKTSLPEN